MDNTHKISWLNSIQTRVALITMLIATLILGAATIYGAIETRKSMTSELTTLAKTTAARLSNHLIYPLWDLDKDQIDKILAAEMGEQRIYGLLVRDADGKTIFSAAKRNKNWEPEGFSGGGFRVGGMTYSKASVQHSDNQIGSVAVYITNKFLDAELQDYYLQAIIQLVVVDLFIFLTMFFALKKIVINPIYKLSQAADAMSMGDFESKLQLNNKNEIGQVAASMERMKMSLKIAMSKIQASHAG